ncbi:MAG: hypothetical protein H6646_09725 [Anaerolineales bacterium]|nr:hypothetical protein [Anaerolineae bacterium]MCB9129729.1 hypothetical protein [Anaerolineales bacterium]MCB9142530.1 hypothetical protein [Anaerolineales bacterium]MCO5246545.1 hypothetical protein [Anaerolineae bacterium]
MNEEQRPYTSYLLRLWQTQSDRELVWRASLESPKSGDRQGFASMKALFAFLEEQTSHATFSPNPEGEA